MFSRAKVPIRKFGAIDDRKINVILGALQCICDGDPRQVLKRLLFGSSLSAKDAWGLSRKTNT